MEYTVDYFIEKFSAIDSDDIGTGSLKKHCSLYYCGVVEQADSSYLETEESIAFGKILEPQVNRGYSPMGNVYNLNDGHVPNYQQETPKERILACLNDIKAKSSG